MTAQQLAEMEQWLAHLHQGTTVAPLDWFVTVVADHAALTARLAAVEGERDAARERIARAQASIIADIQDCCAREVGHRFCESYGCRTLHDLWALLNGEERTDGR